MTLWNVSEVCRKNEMVMMATFVKVLYLQDFLLHFPVKVLMEIDPSRSTDQERNNSMATPETL